MSRNILPLKTLLQRMREQEKCKLANLMNCKSKFDDVWAKNDSTKRVGALSVLLENELRYLGSYDLAYLMRGFEGVMYEEVVLDVGEKVGAAVLATNDVEANELAILSKAIGDAWMKMSVEERKILLETMEYKYSSDSTLSDAIPPFLVGGLLAQNLGWFSISRLMTVLLNSVLSALGVDLVLGGIGGALFGPVGWIVTVAWIGHLAMGPAYRKTVPSVIFIAALRQILKGRGSICVVGSSNAGKDTFIKKVFELPAKPSHLSGSTSEAKSWTLDQTDSSDPEMIVINTPGMDDRRDHVRNKLHEYISETRLIVQIIDIDTGVNSLELELYNDLCRRCFDGNTQKLVVLNKADSPRDAEKLNSGVELALQTLNLKRKDVIVASLDPDPRNIGDLHTRELDNLDKIRNEIILKLRDTGLDTAYLERLWAKKLTA